MTADFACAGSEVFFKKAEHAPSLATVARKKTIRSVLARLKPASGEHMWNW
ncbi:hypothetical protein [Chromobacterium subtsugae]|uniref:hypothetical protein n=1 Tax=Chromobacterium subtsugae TaxID=251747 RepID=UPI000B0B0997|nr:hypothetical protein [Chromobacterium subtsugae]